MPMVTFVKCYFETRTFENKKLSTFRNCMVVLMVSGSCIYLKNKKERRNGFGKSADIAMAGYWHIQTVVFIF